MSETLRQFKAGIFQALAHPTRIAIVETLREGELSAGAIIEKLALEQANVSQHLAVLRTRHIVVSRKEGNQVQDIMRSYFQAHIEESVTMLHELEQMDNTESAKQ